MSVLPADAAHPIANRIREFVFENFVMTGAPEDIPLDRSLVQEGLLDSFGIVELSAWIEKTFEITIQDSELVPEHFGSIHLMSQFVERKRGEASAR